MTTLLGSALVFGTEAVMETETGLPQNATADLPVFSLKAQVSGIFIVSVCFLRYIKTANLLDS